MDIFLLIYIVVIPLSLIFAQSIDGSLKPFIDRWTLVHLVFWFVIGANYSWHSVPIGWAIAITVVGAYIWEIIESILEKKNLVTGSESPWNRWLSDPVISLFGAWLGYSWINLAP